LHLLSEARDLIAHGWTQGADARDASGAPVDAWAPSAVSWSLLGALVAVLEHEAATTGEIPLDELAAALYALANVVDTDSLAIWNDGSDRDQAEVIGVVGAATNAYVSPAAAGPASLN
jgi:hypothetical protein